jgi:ferredoxin
LEKDSNIQAEGMIKKIIDKYIDTYFITHMGNKTYILLYKPYHPYEQTPHGYAYLNAFYPASNDLYFISKEIEHQFAEYNAVVYKGQLKKLFLDTKCAIFLKNCLVAIPPHGTRIALSAIEMDQLNVEEKVANFSQEDRICEGCKICSNHCPTGALKGGFSRELCLRYASDHPEDTSVDLNLIGKSILGCDACQEVCPYNASVESVPMPEDLLSILKIEDLIKKAEGGRKYLEELCHYVGNNYNRPGRILRLAKNANDQESRDLNDV